MSYLKIGVATTFIIFHTPFLNTVLARMTWNGVMVCSGLLGWQGSALEVLNPQLSFLHPLSVVKCVINCWRLN